MLSEHWDYVSDARRTNIFETAIIKTLRRSDHVLDLGCGVGILGALCLRAGAAKVTAMERTAVEKVAAETFLRSGHAGKTRVLRGLSNRMAMNEPVDMIICDHVGYFGLDYGILSLLQDARARFLRTDGRIMPEALNLFLAPIGSDACALAAFGWSGPEIIPELHWITRYSVNSKHAVNLDPQDILGAPIQIGSVDFRTETRSFFSWKTELTIKDAGEMHGLAGWFDCTLGEGVKMTNSPLDPGRIDRSQAFFPLSKPLKVSPGDVIRATIATRPDDGLFAWTVEHVPSGWRCRQSTWEGQVLGASNMRNARPEHVPSLTADARNRNIVLSYCDGQRTVADIEAAVLSEHPDLLPTPDAISHFVAACLGASTQ